MLATWLSTSAANAVYTDMPSNVAVGGGICAFIEFMKSEMAKGNGGLVFVNPAFISKLSHSQFLLLNTILVGGIVVVVENFYLLPKILKGHWKLSKNIAESAFNIVDNITLEKITNHKSINRSTSFLRKYYSKIFIPFKYIDFIEKLIIQLVKGVSI